MLAGDIRWNTTKVERLVAPVTQHGIELNQTHPFAIFHSSCLQHTGEHTRQTQQTVSFIPVTRHFTTLKHSTNYDPTARSPSKPVMLLVQETGLLVIALDMRFVKNK